LVLTRPVHNPLYILSMVQVNHGLLLQFADDTCLICRGDTNECVSKMLSDDLSSWISASWMQVNVRKSSVMWFRIRQSKARVSPPTCVSGWIFVVLCWAPQVFGGSFWSTVELEYSCWTCLPKDELLFIFNELSSSSVAIAHSASRFSCIISADLCSSCLGPLPEGKFVISVTSLVHSDCQNYLWFTKVWSYFG